jgi:hypothetical protein
MKQQLQQSQQVSLIKKYLRSKKDNNKKKSVFLPNDFDVEVYKKINKDLSHFTNEEAKYHFINHGFYEQRLYKIELPNGFDVEVYKKINKDLSHFTDEEAKYHFINHGFYEQRLYKIEIPNDFDVEVYKKINEDLSHFTNEEAMVHYINYGFYERRRYKIELPRGFDVEVYKKINEDLSHFTNEEAMVHYINYGFYERRSYSHNKQENNDYYNCNINNLDNIKRFKLDDENTYNFDNISIFRNDKIDKNIGDLVDYKSFILVIDFPESYVGGTNSFLNSIILKYKDKQDFLILRKKNENFVFTINDEIKLINNFNESQVINFLKFNITKIVKIFINHIMDYSEKFLFFLFRMNKEVSTITHDYSLIKGSRNSQPYYDQLCSSEDDNNLINLFDKIITQNEVNVLNIKNKLVENKDNIIISELPDFKKKQEIITSKNKEIIIGVIGSVTEEKGYKIIEDINKYIKNNELNMKVIIIGSCTDKNILHEEYTTINEFNNLLIKYKPNVLIETTIWPETYSYSLTLCMLTGLPIICFDKKFPSVIKNRLENYDKKHYVDQVDKNLFDLINKVKQIYFFTVKTVKYFNSFWDDYFITNEEKTDDKFLTNNKNLVLITSKIIVSESPLIYIDKRSSYTREERFQQTIETIKSIRQYIPNSYIVIVDNSELNTREIVQLKNIVDKFINITFDELLNNYTDNSPYKGYGELMQQVTFYNEFLKFVDTTKINYFFKISGRYLINEEFDFKIYDNDGNIFKKNEQITNRNYYYTSFYKIDKNYLHKYFNNLYKIIIDSEHDEWKKRQELQCNKCFDLEVLIPETMINDITLVPTLGITQILANKRVAEYHESKI